MEREVGGGIGMGNTCKPMAVSFQCMTKSTNKKKIKIKIKKKIFPLVMKTKIPKSRYQNSISGESFLFWIADDCLLTLSLYVVEGERQQTPCFVL